MLDKAAAHFSRYGFDSSTRAVAEALGVTQALIYKHFASKDDLIEQTLEKALGQKPGGETWLDGDLPIEIGGHMIELANHGLDLGDLTALFVDFEALQADDCVA